MVKVATRRATRTLPNSVPSWWLSRMPAGHRILSATRSERHTASTSAQSRSARGDDPFRHACSCGFASERWSPGNRGTQRFCLHRNALCKWHNASSRAQYNDHNAPSLSESVTLVIPTCERMRRAIKICQTSFNRFQQNQQPPIFLFGMATRHAHATCHSPSPSC